MERTRRRSSAEAGFNLVELLVVLALIGLLAVWGYPSLLQTLAKLRLTNTAREAAVFMQVARMEATKRSVPTRVIFQDGVSAITGKPSLLAFADLDSDGAYDPDSGGGDTDIDRIVAGPYELPAGIDLWGPGDADEQLVASVDGWCVAPPAIDCGPTFLSNGSATATGAFRFRDRNGNFLETRVEFQGTGKVVLQKYFDGLGWFENGESGHEWKWYSD